MLHIFVMISDGQKKNVMFIYLISSLDLQERRESSRSNRDYRVENSSRLNDKKSGDRDSDTSEGDSRRR